MQAVRQKLLLLCASLILVSSALAEVDANAKKFKIIGGDSLPFFGPSEKKNRPGGTAGTFIRRAFEKAGLLNDSSAEITYDPWKRAQQIAAETEYSIIPLARSKERDAKYDLLGRIYVDEICAFRLKSSKVPIGTLEQIHNANVVVTAGSVMETRLTTDWGFKDTSKVLLAKESNTRALKLLIMGRADTYIDTASIIKNAAIELKADPNDFECGMVLGKNEPYVMTSKKSPEAFSKAIRAIVEDYRKTDEYKKWIIDQGLKSE